MAEPDELKSCKESHSFGTKTCSVISQSYKPFVSSKYTRRPLSTNAEFDDTCITEPANEFDDTCIVGFANEFDNMCITESENEFNDMCITESANKFNDICITEPPNEALPISETAFAPSGFEQQLVIGLNFKHLKEHLADKIPLTTTSAVLIKEHSYPITTPVVFCSQMPIKNTHCHSQLEVERHSYEITTSAIVESLQTSVTNTYCYTYLEAPTEYESNDAFNLSSSSAMTLESFRLMCPLYNSDITSGSCDHNGGILTSENGIKITIPEGAIRPGVMVNFYIAVGLYGHFVLPSNCLINLASPYYWVEVSRSYHFQKPIQVEFEHFGACDPSHYQLLCCEDDDESYTMRPVGYNLNFKVQDNISRCTFETQNFCSYCLYHNCRDPMINRICALYLKPANFQCLNHFQSRNIVYFSY